MTEDEKIGTAEREPEGKSGGCCEPACGPETCGTTVVLKVEEKSCAVSAMGEEREDG